MAYPSLTRRRRTRRRRRLIIAIVLAVLIGIIALAVRYRTERREVSDYLGLAKIVADEEVQISAGLADLVSSLGEMNRSEMLASVARLETRAEGVISQLTTAAVPRPVGKAHGFLFVATTSWAEAIALLDDAISQTVDLPEDPGGPGLLQSAFDGLRVGDRAYAGFKQAVGELDPDTVIWEYPDVGYTADPVLYDAELLSLRLVLMPNLGLQRDIAVSATTNPAPVGASGDIPLLPFSVTFEVQVVVSNEGNLPEEEISVTVELAALNATAETFVVTQTVDTPLQPGEATTLTFTDLPAVPGGPFELVVRSQIPEDSDTTNDVWRFIFFRNENS